MENLLSGWLKPTRSCFDQMSPILPPPTLHFWRRYSFSSISNHFKASHFFRVQGKMSHMLKEWKHQNISSNPLDSRRVLGLQAAGWFEHILRLSTQVLWAAGENADWEQPGWHENKQGCNGSSPWHHSRGFSRTPNLVFRKLTEK